MPVDASIPLAVNAPQIDLGSVMGTAMKLREMQHELQTQNALKAVFAKPDAVDPKTGLPTANTLAMVTRLDPAMGTKLTSAIATTQEREAQTEHVKSETQTARSTAYRTELSQRLGVYDDEVKSGNIEPKEAERKLKDGIHEYLFKDAGIPESQRDSLWAKVEGMSPTQLRALTLTADQRAARDEEARKETEERVPAVMGGKTVMVDKQGNVYDPNTREKLKVTGPVEKEGTVLDPARAAMQNRHLALEERALKLREKVAAGGAAALTDDDETFAAELLLNGMPMPNMGYGAAGAEARKRILHKAATMASEQSGSAAAGADATVVRKETLAADKASITAAKKQEQSVRQFSQTATALADKVDGLVNKVASGGPEAYARWMQHVKLKYFADEDTREFLGYVTDLQSENAKIMAGATGSVAQVSAHNQDMMNHMLSGDMPVSEIRGALKSIREGIRLRNEAVEQEVTRQSEQLKGDTAGGGHGGSNAHGGSIAHPTSKADYDALPSGAHYSKPGDAPGTYRVKP